MEPQPLTGRVIANPETREIEIFAAISSVAVAVVRCPMVAIRDARSGPRVALEPQSSAQGLRDLILLTAKDAAHPLVHPVNEPALKDAFVQALGAARKNQRAETRARIARARLKRTLQRKSPRPKASSQSACSRLQGRRIGCSFYEPT